MSNENRFVHGFIKIVTCQNCESHVPIFEFDSETDNDTVGLCSAALCNSQEVLIAEVTQEEWRKMYDGELLHLPPRLSGTSELQKLHVLHIKRIDEGPEPEKGMSFSEYREIYQSPVLVYSCPCCGEGDAIETEEFSISEFEKKGGRVISLGNLRVK